MSNMHMVIESYKHNSCQSEHGRGGHVQMAVYRRVGHNRAGVAGYIGHHVHIYTWANVPQAEQGQDIMCRFRTGAFLRGAGRRRAGRVMCGVRKNIH